MRTDKLTRLRVLAFTADRDVAYGAPVRFHQFAMALREHPLIQKKIEVISRVPFDGFCGFGAKAGVWRHVPRIVLAIALVMANRRRFLAADRVLVRNEYDLLAIGILTRSSLRKTIFVQREDNVLKWMHKLYGRQVLARWRGAIRIIIQRNLRQLLKRVLGVVVQTPAHKATLTETGVPDRTVHVLPNNIPERVLEESLRWRRVAFAGRCRALMVVASDPNRKGLDEIARFVQSPKGNKTLVDVVGMDRPAAYQGQQNLKFFGRKNNWYLLISGYDVLLAPTKYDDFPNVILEAIGVGIPIVASNIEAHRHILGEDFPFFFEVGDSGALSAAIRRATVELNVQSWQEMCDRLRKRWTFDWDQAVRMLINEYL